MKLPENLSLDILDTHTSSRIYNWSFQFFKDWGLDSDYAHIINSIFILFVVAIFLLIIDFLARKILKGLLIRIIQRTTNAVDDLLIQNKTLNYICPLFPLIVGQNIVPIIFIGFPEWTETVNKILSILMIITIVLLINSLLMSFADILRKRKRFVDKPIDSYRQVFSIILYSIAGIGIFSVITGSSPWSFLVSLGAASAILMLVFKDTILGFVASIQVSSNDSLRLGDWIEMPKHNADGHVIEINLNTVKVQNWDMTISTIPTHLLITESLKNYRSMQASGGRRIKRAIHIKISSIRFLQAAEIQKLRQIELLRPYIDERQAEIDSYNENNHIDKSILVNGRNMTNIGLLREYILRYTQNNPKIHKEMLLFVRQMTPTEKGLPLELYMFSNEVGIVAYEKIMADIFDHVFASIPYFYLEVFELPASDDIRSLNLAKGMPVQPHTT